MIDIELLRKKLAFIETLRRELTELARPELIAIDIREQRFVQHSLQLAIQAALDVGSHIVSAKRLGEPESNRELFDLLARDDWLSVELTERLYAMAGLRNILVHGYQVVDNEIIRDVVEHHLSDLDAFVAQIRSHLA